MGGSVTAGDLSLSSCAHVSGGIVSCARAGYLCSKQYPRMNREMSVESYPV